MKRGNVGNGWKAAIAGMSVTAMICCAVCGSMAWLMDTTAPVTNTFTASKVEVKLEETTSGYKMIPGWTIAKDPKVTVAADSEDCYVFIEVDESEGFDDYMAYAIDTTIWTAGTGTGGDGIPTNVYYRKVMKSDTTKTFGILAGGSYTMTGVGTFTWAANQVLVLPTVTEAMMEAAETNQPTLKFKAHAVQLYKSNNAEFTAAEAWGQIPDSAKITSVTSPTVPTT